MESALRPREIQARIRSGESLADVAERAGVPQERIEVYATPVYAERGHIATMAMAASARRRGDATVHRTLRTILSERLMARGVDVESVDWDAWKLPDRRWRVEARYAGVSPSSGDPSPVVALFTFDPVGRFSVAANDEARWLLGELSTTRAGERRVRDEDGEPTVDLDDEFALVRALGRGSKNDASEAATSEIEAPRQQVRPEDSEAEAELEASSDVSTPSETPMDRPSKSAPEPSSPKPAKGRRRGRSRGAPPTATEPSDSRQSEPEPVPGAGTPDDVYDVLPTPESELDALYEMLGGFNEDSVNIYAGLNEPVTEPAPVEKTGERKTVESATEADPVLEPEPQSEADELEQPSLIEEADSPAPAKKPRANKKRASIPSWDEIMFGGPKP